MKFLIIVLASLSFLIQAQSQTVNLSGFIVDKQNNRKLQNAEIKFTSANELSKVTTSDKFGKYNIDLDKSKTYQVEIIRIAYKDAINTVTISETIVKDMNQDFQLQRLPGYEFQADVKELLSGGNGIEKKLGKELKNIKIEIFNNTSGKDIRVTEDDPSNSFEVNFERGNHYTILLRKQGYYAKRIEVNVDIFGCILCFEGLGNDYAPEIESATEDSERGILIGDIPMKKIVKDEAIRLENIYYDYDKWAIRADAKPGLEKLVRTMKSNPIIIELGSHTDSRGKSDYNLTLSEKRAKSAVDYLISKGIKSSRMSSKGYGEEVPLNNCVDGQECDEAGYQFNRRTEFKVIGFLEKTNFDKKSLKQILEEEKLTKKRIKEQIEGL